MCIEALSVDLEEPILRGASNNVTQLRSAITGAKRSAAERLEREYTRIVTGLPLAVSNAEHSRSGARQGGLFSGGEEIPLAPVLPNDVLKEAVPESVRKAEEFVEFLNRLVAFLRKRASTETVSQEKPRPFLTQLASACDVTDRKAFQATYDRLISLLLTVRVSSWAEFRPVLLVGDFVTLLGTYEREGMAVITEPYNDFTGEYEPVMRLACLDASLAIRWVMEKFRTVVITSGTLSPLDTYPRMMNFRVVVSASFNMSMDRRCVCPLVMTRGSDQVALSSRYNDRQTADIPRNYGLALVALAGSVPDGVVVFFVSYVFMQQVVKVWTEESDVLNELRKLKLVFVETQDPLEASLAIQNYRRACDSGRGAILLSVARGRAAEGIDFDGQYGRAVILFGVPFQYTESRVLKARLQFLSEHFQIQEDDFLVFDVSCHVRPPRTGKQMTVLFAQRPPGAYLHQHGQFTDDFFGGMPCHALLPSSPGCIVCNQAMRQAAQCAGRVIRNKNDYGIVIFADKRFARAKLRGKLPKWIAQFLTSTSLDLDVGSAIAVARAFLLDMAQPTVAKLKFEAPSDPEYEPLMGPAQRN